MSSLRLYVGVATVPGRESTTLPRAISSLLSQTRLPERIFVAMPAGGYTLRGELRGRAIAPTADVLRHPLVEIRRCARDDGPGTKLLCTLPRALELAVAADALDSSIIVLADDDRIYRDWALGEIARAAWASRRPHTTSADRASARAFSFYSWDVWLPHARGICYGPCECGKCNATKRRRRSCCFGRQYLSGATPGRRPQR